MHTVRWQHAGCAELCRGLGRLHLSRLAPDDPGSDCGLGVIGAFFTRKWMTIIWSPQGEKAEEASRRRCLC